LAVLLTLAGAGCGSSSNEPLPPAPVSFDVFPEEFAARYCRRVYDCCLPADRAAVSPGTDEAMCTAGMTENARDNAELLFTFPGIGYDAAAAGRCLAVLERYPCGDIFEPTAGVLVACQDVFAGTLPLQTSCEDGHQCASGTCDGATCAVTVRCAPGEIVSDSNGCLPQVGLGQSCALARQCPPEAGCPAGVCKRRGQVGATCSVADDCAGTCGISVDTGRSACRPGLCLGQ
jgi:hypothetical protein